MLRILAITLLALAIVVTAAAAQTTTTTQPAPSTSTPNQGAFDKLSPGNQKIARALYEAQPSGSTTTTTKPLSLNDIAAMKQSGKGWGVIFKDMKANGQLPPDAKNLGQLVSGKYHPQSSTTITSASGKSQTTGKSGTGHFDDDASAGTHGSSDVSSGSGKGSGNASSPGTSAGRGSNGGGQGVGRGK